MRKIVAVFISLAMIVVFFTACNIGGDDKTTTGPIATGDVITTTEPTTTAKPEPMSYILTTSPDKTAPWQETSRFDIASVEIPTSDLNNITFPSGDIERPDVNISSVPTSSTVPTIPTIATVPNTIPTSGNTTTTKAPTTTTKATTTTEAEKFPTALVVDSEAFDSNSGKLYLSISPSSWSTDIKANSTSIAIKIDGVAASESVPCSVTSGKNADGMQEIIIDLSSQSVSTGSTITYTIPSNFLVSKSGTQYNTSFTSSVAF